MIQLQHLRNGGRRVFAGLLLVFALVGMQVGTLKAAGTTGTITATVTDSTGHPLNGVKVAASSPTGSYAGTTDTKGFVAFSGVTPDTYVISFELTGYQPIALSGLTVFADQTVDASTKLSKSLTTIGRSAVKASSGNAFQPKQTQDTYAVTTTQINTLLGKADNVSETNLLTRLPGASLDKYGYPVLRGGRENEEGFEFDGIPEVDAFTAQFTNSLSINGNVSGLQLTPGAGDVSVGGAGTGAINLVAKRGAYPAFGSLDAETNVNPFVHQLSFEYGFATPNGKISNYFSFLGSTSSYQLGEYGEAIGLYTQGGVLNPQYISSRDFLDNFVFKFGHNNNQSIQLLYDNQQSNFLGTYGGNGTFGFASSDPFTLANYLQPYTGLTKAQLQNPAYFPLLPYQGSLSDSLAAENRGAENTYQPNNVFKVQYTNNLSDKAFVTAKFYEVDSVATFDYPDEGGAGSIWSLQGGHRDGGTIDFSLQASAKHLFEAGGEYDFLHPVFDDHDPFNGALYLGAFGSNFEIADFVAPNDPNCPLGPGACGYLYQYQQNPGPFPYLNEITSTNRQDYSFYLRDKYTPNSRLNVDYGVRLEGSNYQIPGLTGCNPTLAQIAAGTAPDTCQYAPTSFTTGVVNGNSYQVPSVTLQSGAKNPFLVEPRIAVSFQMGSNDAVRASFARSAEFAPLADVDTTGASYPKYANIPSYSAALGGGPAMTCGVTGNLTCQNYGDQLHWELQNALGVPITPVKPETFTNWEFSYSHQFPQGVSVKLTPFYRRGYDALALVNQPLVVNGAPVIDPATGNITLGPTTATNLGLNRTTGVEFFLSKEAAYGLSGTLSATYINEFSNVVPSPLIQEDFFPPIPTQSLLLGNQYRVGFVSPFTAALGLQYKTHGGVRVNPIVTYSRGYPAGVGNITASYINGTPVNLPNTNGLGASAPFGANYSPNYVDPQNPGSLYKPNIAASRGTPETASAAGFITNPRVNTNISLEYSPPGSRSTFGVLVSNLFNQIYSSNVTYNSRYQPVATGISGPKTGMSTTPLNYPGEGLQQYVPYEYGQDPYRIIPSATPQTVRLYYQLSL